MEVLYIEIMRRTIDTKPIVGALELTDRDKLWIRAVHRFRLITTDQAVLLVNGGNRNAINARLAKLRDHDYLQRPRVQLEQSHREKRHTVHALGQKGAKWLEHNDGVMFPKGKGWTTANQLKSIDRMLHDIGVVDTVLHVVNAVEDQSSIGMIHQQELLAQANWPPRLKNFRLPTQIMKQGQLFSRGTDPDYTFALTKTVDGEERKALFFLEYDNATEDFIKADSIASSIAQKHICYNDAHERKLQRVLYGISNFRVLFVVADTKDRIRKMRATFDVKIGNPARAGVFLYTTVTELEARGALADIWVDATGRRTAIV